VSVANEAREAADRVVSTVLGEVLREFDDRRDNPVYWYAFHDAMLRGMSKHRRRVAWWHKLMRRRYKAHVAAKAAYAKACGVECAA